MLHRDVFIDNWHLIPFWDIFFLHLEKKWCVSLHKFSSLISSPSFLNLWCCSILLKWTIIFDWKLNWLFLLEIRTIVNYFCYINTIFVLRYYVIKHFWLSSAWITFDYQWIIFLYQFIHVDLLYCFM